jgi:hypothetical protein
LSWGLNKLSTFRIATAAMLVGLATAAAADVLVVRATGPSAGSYPAGRSLPDNSKINLRANDTLTILVGSNTRTLRGPGTFTPTGPATSGTPLASATSANQRRARIGAVRGMSNSVTAAARNPSIWNIDIARSSNVCVTDPAHATLWRADASRPAALTITRASDGRSGRVEMGAGQAVASWPKDVPISDGGEYTLSWRGAAEPTRLMFKTLSKKPAELNDMASSLIQHACDAQLDLLIETVRLPEDRATPAG